MIKYTIAREDTVYKCFPDLARCDDGTLVLVYRESMGHLWYPFTRIAIQRSFDDGCTWTLKMYLDNIIDVEVDGGWNNPRIICTGGSNLLLICDWLPPKAPEWDPGTVIYLWRSTDAGATWSTRQDTKIRGHICPCLTCLKDGTLILAGDRNCRRPPDDRDWRHNGFISADCGFSWEGPFLVGHDPDLYLNEGTIVELADGILVDYLREDKQHEWAYKSISADGGKTWNGPYRTRLAKCIGRPKAGLLASGEVAVTYGFDLCPRNLVLHVESALAAAAADPDVTLTAGYQPGSEIYRRFQIDHDRSVFHDGGYSGWASLPGGDIYVVQYIVDDAPMAQIRGYRLSRQDYILADALAPMPNFTWDEKMKAHELIRGVTNREDLDVAPYHDYYQKKLQY